MFDRDGYNVAQSARIPQHLNSMGAGLLTLVRDFLALDRWEDGDVVITNDLGRALTDLEQAVTRVGAELARRKPPPEAEEARRKMALNFIKTDVPQGRALEDLSADKLELLETLLAICLTVMSPGWQQVHRPRHAQPAACWHSRPLRRDGGDRARRSEPYTLRARLN